MATFPDYCLVKESVLIRCSYKRPTLQSKQWWGGEWSNRIVYIIWRTITPPLILAGLFQVSSAKEFQQAESRKRVFSAVAPLSVIFSCWNWGPRPGLPEDPKNVALLAGLRPQYRCVILGLIEREEKIPIPSYWSLNSYLTLILIALYYLVLFFTML